MNVPSIGEIVHRCKLGTQVSVLCGSCTSRITLNPNPIMHAASIGHFLAVSYSYNVSTCLLIIIVIIISETQAFLDWGFTIKASENPPCLGVLLPHMLDLPLLSPLKFCHNMQEMFNQMQIISSIFNEVSHVLNGIAEHNFSSAAQFSAAVSE